MVWRDQDPPAADVLLDVTVQVSGGGSPAYLEIDKLPDGRYRTTVGTLFQEICRTADRRPRGAGAPGQRHGRLPLVRRRGARHPGAADAWGILALGDHR